MWKSIKSAVVHGQLPRRLRLLWVRLRVGFVRQTGFGQSVLTSLPLYLQESEKDYLLCEVGNCILAGYNVGVGNYWYAIAGLLWILVSIQLETKRREKHVKSIIAGTATADELRRPHLRSNYG